MDFLPYDQDKDLNASGLKDGFTPQREVYSKRCRVQASLFIVHYDYYRVRKARFISRSDRSDVLHRRR